VIATGSTGGKHRSVALAEAISQALQGEEYRVYVTHRDVHRDRERER